MKKWFGIVLMIFSAILVLGACSGGGDDGSSESNDDGASEGSGDKVTVKIGVPGASTHPFTIGAEHFSELVNEASDDFDIQIFDNGQMGGERELAEAAKIGTLD